MANKTVLVQTQLQAMNIDALNRSAVAEVEIENGMVFQLATQSTADNEGEVCGCYCSRHWKSDWSVDGL